MDFDICAEYLKECFKFDFDGGILTWKSRPESHFSSKKKQSFFNNRFPGKEFGFEIVGRGDLRYRRGSLNGKMYRTHRIIWVMHHGPIPEGMQIDHISHDGLDNRLCNLRLVTGKENSKNLSMNSKNSSGFTGVGWYQPYKKWQAKIHINGKTKHIGYFTEKCDAIKARIEAQEMYGFHANHGAFKNKY